MNYIELYELYIIIAQLYSAAVTVIAHIDCISAW